jgi:branched-chain amino acid transport system substrate-binding protein
MKQRTTRSARATHAACLVALVSLVAGACAGTDDGADAPQSSAASTVASTAPTDSSDTTADTPDTSTADTGTTDLAGDPYLVFPTLAAPAGEPMVVGLVNTEGVPGLDFPDVREAIQGGVDYLGQHGGFGGRPVQLETCIAKGSPESSQQCAQELVGKDVELVLLGLDVFPDYATYTAAGVPVIGVLPILPGDYSADALFLTGGNATVMAAVALAAQQHFGATSVGIVSADNPGSNSSEASLTAALDLLQISHTTVKGGDNETDAGFQGLVQEVTSDDPDLLVSLYADAGCIGMMRARTSLAIEIPVITTGICSSTEVLDQVGDDAVGWNFVGVSTRADTPASRLVQEIMAPVLDVAPDDVDQASLGLGALGLYLVMSLAVYANEVAAAGGDVTGEAIREHLATADDLKLWPGTSPIACGASPDYPSICSFTFPFAEYVSGGEVRTIEGLEALSVLDHLP